MYLKMASVRMLAVYLPNLLNKSNSSFSSHLNKFARLYSVFPPTYIKPVYNKDAQKEMEAAGEKKVISHLPIKPALSDQTSSPFHDPEVNKFINYMTKEGNKERARYLMEKTFEKIKRIQLERYNKAKTIEDQDKIELNPKVLLHQAVQNSSPVLELLKMKKGGQTYQVPVPLTDKRSRFLAMNWLVTAGKEKEKHIHLPEKLAYEIIDAANNQGRVIRKKQELYRQCEANRSYAHFRWA